MIIAEMGEMMIIVEIGRMMINAKTRGVMITVEADMMMTTPDLAHRQLFNSDILKALLVYDVLVFHFMMRVYCC